MVRRAKLIKSLYSRLKACQENDVALTAPAIVEMKHYLRNHPKCSQVWVEDIAHPTNIPITLSAPSELPIFLQSQLQAQKGLADNLRPSVQACVILRFAARHLARRPKWPGTFPTLFRFSELLGLRDSQSSNLLCDKVKANPELGEIIIKHNGTVQPRRLKKAKDDAISSTDSDEHIVFQGKRQSRLPVNNLDGETQWKYRGRSGSERNSIEPIAAPTGLDTQQNEGFQRFFKAVVSPTHVRVTAGGRIVPNTRNATSPTAKWDKERADPESDSGELSKNSSSENVTDQDGNAHQPTPTAPTMVLPPMAHHMYPGYPPMFAPFGAPVPFYPIPNGMPMPYGFPQAPIPAASAAKQPAAQSDKQRQTEDKPESPKTQYGQEEEKKVKPAPIKISPPEQFDQARPYFFNGNVFYPGGPLPMQSQATPMTPSPYFGGFPVHPTIARASSFGQPSPMLPMPGPHMLGSPAFAPLLSAGAPQPTQPLSQSAKPEAVSKTPTAKPPITSIKPSQITQSQLTALRSQLKYYEDQLQYNKHQIDEKSTRDQIQTIRKLIGQFEHNYQVQVSFEKTIYPNSDKRVVTMGSELPHCRTPSTPGMKENIVHSGSQAGSMRSIQRSYPTLNHTQSMDQIRHKTVKDLRQRAGINSSKGMDTTSALCALEAHLTRGYKQDPVKKSSLPTRAAMAPIFEPRGNTPSMLSLEPSDLGSIADADQSSELDNPATLLLNKQGLWPSMSSSGHIYPDIGPAATMNGTEGSTAPYLVGKLPNGLGATSGHAGDCTYSRDLTNEEKRARHVYWGGISVKGSGLPKFDGKDFYPASPVKSSEKIDTTPKANARQVPMGQPEAEYSFGSNKKSEDPFHITRDTESTRSARKLSHAVPIINPETMAREEVKVTPKAVKPAETQAQSNTRNQYLEKSPGEKPQTSPVKTPTASTSEKKVSSAGRRALERSSKGSSNDLWQSMMKKASTSGAATPGSVSSMTANGFLPQLGGHAVASLTPAMTNANDSLRVLSGGKGDAELPGKRAHSEKTGENRPPTDLPSSQADIIADLHQRMLRDAERRGVIGPGWQ
ncbi:hypothetical protein BKA67DRAFT_663710 [Truncatella angustata]|uniref:Uncharacterized protein n=1 Tax=Truncatella angustata TaxID=152316 RepID=A0A9P8UBB7_9PEZI|nr:uncharacterized protein BKA67DRAFT_663710 [Truncatella angustata]KAH6645827.1 hypothetical protein BKA67DRAFT_663710 [Truncatella angustata]